ncbi:MAG: hypothetical protein ABIJ61_02870 [bacterium]
MKAEHYESLVDDLDWLWNIWWAGQPDSLSAGDLRRGSTTLDLLLTGGLLGRAWRSFGFDRQPQVCGPDISAYLQHEGLKPELTIGLIAGGGRQRGLDLSLLGAFRVDNPETGVPAEADVGFAVKVSVVSRTAAEHPPEGEFEEYIERPWYVSDYLNSIGGIRLGKSITRREVIQYFRNYTGGAHHFILGNTKSKKLSQHQIAAEIDRSVHADFRHGLHFELLSIGQAVARSRDVRSLVDRIRKEIK